MMALEILVAVKWPFFHRAHFTPQRIIKKICLMLTLDVIISILHFFYGYSTALDYVPQVQTVAASETTIAGNIFWTLLMILTTIPCLSVILFSTLTVMTLRRMFKTPHNSLSNGNIQRDPLTGATRISYSVGPATTSNGEEPFDNIQSITIKKATTSSRENKQNIKISLSNRSAKGTRQFTRRNFLTILFGLRFSALWFGSLFVSMLIILFKKYENETTLIESSYWNITELNHTLHIESNFSTHPFDVPTRGTFQSAISKTKQIRIIRLNIVFYCVCLLGIEDMIFYIVCNKRFRSASINFLWTLCPEFCSKLAN